MRPGALCMRIVVGPHEIVDQVPAFGELESRVVLLEGRRAVASKVFAGQLLQLRVSPQMMFATSLVHRIQRPRYPSDSALHCGEFQLWKSLQDSGAAQARDRLNSRRQRMRNVVNHRATLLARGARVSSGRDMKGDRQVAVLDDGPHR